MFSIPENKRELDISNISLWHDLGFDGDGIKVAEIEGYNTDSYVLKGRVTNPFGNGKPGGSTHGTQVLDVAGVIVAPKAKLYCFPFSVLTENGHVTGKFVEEVIPYIIKENIDLVGASLGGLDLDELNKKIVEAKENGTSFITSAGNSGNKGVGKFARTNEWISVGAVGYDDKLNKIFRKSYSSIGKELDIVSFSGLYVHPVSEGHNPFQVEGTSFSSPFAMGMCALVQQFFKENVGRTLYQDELEKFVYDHIIDLGSIGWDDNYGHGLFVLPHPSDIEIKKYLLRDKSIEEIIEDVITLTIDSKELINNGQVILMDTAPFIKDKRTFVPIRFIVEQLGFEIEWIEKDRKVIIRKKKLTV